MLRLLILFFLLPLTASGETWTPVFESGRREAEAGVTYLKRGIRSASGKTADLQLVFFNSRRCKLKVIDLGASTPSKYQSLAAAFEAHDCVAGVNGGFFQENYQPLGLMIAGGKRTGSFASSGFLTSGVISSHPDGIDLVRRAAFRDSSAITALLQSGPYLVENARPVQGLSDDKSRRRTFIVTDWRRNWAIGMSSSLTLEELSEALVSPRVISEWKVNRALNLDGGSSSGLYFDGVVAVEPWKRVRNLLGVAPR